MLKQLFCSHSYKVVSEHTEKYTEQIHAQGYQGSRPVSDFWGQPILTTRTVKRVLLTCPKCGKTKKEVL